MATQTLLWTVLPYGYAEGRMRVTIVVSPRLTPQAASEQVLKAFPEWLNWPDTLRAARFGLRVGPKLIELKPVSGADSDLWKQLFGETTPVAGFQFKDMSRVNLRSYAVRNVLALLRKHYGRLAVQSAGTHPTLLPWKSAHPALSGMLGDLGVRTQKVNLGDRQIEVPLPGFERFFDDRNKQGLEKQLRDTVFGPDSRYRAPAVGIDVDAQGNPKPGGQFAIRVLPPDWQDPAGNGPDAALMGQWRSASEYTLYQANRYYRREPPSDEQRQIRRPTLKDLPPPPKAPEFDFHRIVASYGDYPELLRRLGLAIDCLLGDDLLGGAAQAQGLMQLEIRWSNSHATASDTRPRTAWQADKERFTARPRSAELARGLLNLRHANDRADGDKRSLYDLYQVDPDGAALKTVDFLLSAQNLVAKSLALGADGGVTYTTGDKQPVAALRSGGLGVSRHGRAALVAQGAAAAALKDQAVRAGAAAGSAVVLFAEDVLRGYRVDVQAAGERWRSLCARRGDYRLIASNTPLDLAPDEGYAKGASSNNPEAQPDDHYLHESLFRWTGWSLVVPRPGRTLRDRVDAASGMQGELPEEVKDEHASGGNGLAASFSAAKGSLPKLRYGVAYRMRARAVDLAGNSLALADASLDADTNVSDAVTYRRYEPVDPPALAQRARGSEGESLERMVIRSNWNAGTAAYLGTPAFAAAIALPASQDFEYAARNERHAVPPKASQQQCETHAMFDALFATPSDIKKAYGIGAREAGTLYEGGELVTPAALANVATTTALPPRLPSLDNPSGDRIAPGQYVIHREASLATPYLPDPAAGGIALRAQPGHGLPGVSGPLVLGPSAQVVFAPNQELVLLVTHAKTWPDTLGLRIVLAEREASLTDATCDEAFADSGAPKWDEPERVLTFFVAKGRIVRLRYASFVHAAHAADFGLPDWVDTDGEREFVRGMAQLGCGWMITPYRPLVLVHATQQPVCEPRFQVLAIAPRNPGDQHATLTARLRLHGPSSGKFEVEADWDEWVDELDKPGPERVASHGALGEVRLDENHANQFGLAAAIDEQVVDTARPRARGDRHEFGDTKFRRIRYTLRATTRFREYLPPSLYAQRDEVTRTGPIADGPQVDAGAPDDAGAPVLVAASGSAPNTLVPASSPPDEPRPLYVVPTFRWSETPGNAKLDVTRQGNGLRVWLERPWFSSGDGELLGVVILGEDKRFTDIGDRLVPLVTQWGLDPLWDTALPKSKTRAADFTARVIAEDVELQELPGQMVRVVGHRVRYSAERQLWYCDIELDPGASYMPFVRLALVRYQPNAIAAAKISRVVLAEFAQVLPRRRATFTRDGSKVTLTLRGRVPATGPMKFPLDSDYQDISFVPQPGQTVETGRNRVELVLQQPDAGIDSDLAWHDVQRLASTLVGPDPGPVPEPPRPPQRRDAPASTVHLASGGSVGPIVVVPPLVDLLDPAIWQATATLPAGTTKPARVALREYERYYTDRTVPEVRAGATRRRRVVEERLVYAAFFEI